MGEDKKLMEWFGTLCEGTYIEMGALDGIRYSNSYAIHKTLNWKGVLIELMEGNYQSLKTNRPNEIATINAGVCISPQKLHYYGARPATGGIYEFSAPEFRKKFWGDIALDDPRVKEIDCDTLDSLLMNHAPHNNFFDFLSLDVEGAELSVFKSIDFDRVGFGIIFAEADRSKMRQLAIRQFMESKGYSFLEVFSNSYWFVNRDFHEIYNDLLW
ncbi:hypothetical protein ACHAXR_009085 [Thalassiosira sp. AJA248-18]